MRVISIVLLALVTLIVPARPHAQSDAGWTPLWNGRDLTGWEHVGPGQFEVKEGALRTVGGMGLLWYTPKKIGKSVLRVVYKPEKMESNSGVFIRIPTAPAEPWMPVHKGYEIQIAGTGDDYHTTGVLYSFTKALTKPGKPGEWNTMEVVLDGPRTTVHVNGTLVTDFTEGSAVRPLGSPDEPARGPRPAEGYIGLQNHGDDDVVWFKEVSVRPLR